MSYPDAAWERAMKVQEVIMKALTGERHWYRAADILGFSARTLRRGQITCQQHLLRPIMLRESCGANRPRQFGLELNESQPGRRADR